MSSWWDQVCSTPSLWFISSNVSFFFLFRFSRRPAPPSFWKVSWEEEEEEEEEEKEEEESGGEREKRLSLRVIQRQGVNETPAFSLLTTGVNCRSDSPTHSTFPLEGEARPCCEIQVPWGGVQRKMLQLRTLTTSQHLSSARLNPEPGSPGRAQSRVLFWLPTCPTSNDHDLLCFCLPSSLCVIVSAYRTADTCQRVRSRLRARFVLDVF